MVSNLLISIDFPPQVGGKQTYLYEIFRRMEDSAVLVSAGEEQNDVDEGGGFTSYRIPRSFFIPLFPFLLVYGLYVVLKESPDRIFAGQILPGGFAAYVLSKITRRQYYVFTFDTIDIFDPLERGWVVRWMYRRALFHAEGVFAISSFAAEQLMEVGVPESDIHVVPPGVDTEMFRPGLETDDVEERHGVGDASVVLTVSRLVERKGHDTVIKALPQIREEVPDVTYLIVGDGPERDRLERLAEERGVDDIVVFAGEVPHAAVPQYYNAADVFVMASKYLEEKHKSEGFGIVLLEANACEVPVVAGDNTGMQDAVVDGETGMLVDAEDNAAVGGAITRLLTDAGLRQEMGETGRRRVEQEFSWEAVAARVEAVLGDGR